MNGAAAVSARLDGFRVGVTSDRRSDELIAALARRGAECVHAPTIRMANEDDLAQIEAETGAIVDAAPHVLLATTSYGIRRWFDVADEAGLGGPLVERLGRAEILVRGPKARGAIRAAGLDDEGMGEVETTEALVDYAIERGVDGRTVAVQLHGATDERQLARLRAAGATVLTVSPYVWHEHEDRPRVDRLIELIIAGGVDAVTFTSAPAAEALFRAAAQVGAETDLRSAFRGVPGLGGVAAVAVGPVTAEPIIERGVVPIVPQRFRMGAMIKSLCDELIDEHVVGIDTVAGQLTLRGRTMVHGGEATSLSPTSLALIRALIAARGALVTRVDLGRAASVSGEGVSIDMAMSRLRAALPSDVVQTIVKRGYRLRLAEAVAAR
ncbi:uroporphyrinogen-III synthase [Pseudoclavibacter endophyticus]|uniref:Uroporphyrinogen-III synthase n=1 Tax=Pseudoclavibacter endophyticus TaxID=1778590 RepID=A0A6H9WQ22_9MICO|nr:uroporphyrinogen-III synthase [Pseudoclavibacter endophyticus]KAB1649801.1 uroporphyrinogen-III synthase [Pseudoclavibacter endophyticus]GGA59650.1 uroporphyrinogen-III synthase [Pseudoclavibacter endophyticus]